MTKSRYTIASTRKWCREHFSMSATVQKDHEQRIKILETRISAVELTMYRERHKGVDE